MKKCKLFACLAAIAFALLAATSTSMAEQKPAGSATLNESIEALFSYGRDIDTAKERLNPYTVTIMTGPLGGTDEQIGADLASVVDDGEKLRLLPVVGRGSAQSVADILYLNNVDLGITRSDTLDYLETKGLTGNLKRRLTYITKLFNEEMHVVAPKAIEKLTDLEGKTISVDSIGALITATAVFDRLGIKSTFVRMEETRGYEKLRKGEIDAMIAIQGSPWKFTNEIQKDQFHFVSIGYAVPLQAAYLPAQLTAKDYPTLIADGERVDTIAVPAILVAYNWNEDTARYRKIARFVKAFFTKFKELQSPPFHAKWRDVVLSAPLKGWKRFPAAQEWLDERSDGVTSETRRQFDQFMATRASASEMAPAAMLDQNAALYKEFLEWRKETDAKPPVRRLRAHRHRISRTKAKSRSDSEQSQREDAPQQADSIPGSAQQ